MSDVLCKCGCGMIIARREDADRIAEQSDLHNRIAAVIAQVAEGRAVYQLTNADASVIADAVIAALGLTIEYSEGDDECRWCWNSPEDAPKSPAPQDIQTRYITPWVRLSDESA